MILLRIEHHNERKPTPWSRIWISSI